MERSLVLRTYTLTSVNSALHTGHATLYDFSPRQHLFHWTRSVTIEQPRPLWSTARCGMSSSSEFVV